MTDSLRLYVRYLALSVRAQLQYRVSFIVNVLTQFMASGMEVIGIWALFDRFGHLEGWTLPQVALFYGTVQVSYALADALSTGFDRFAPMVKSGDFDRLLLRPRTTVLQLAGQELALRRIGRLGQGAIVLTWAVVMLDLDWSLLDAAMIGWAILGAVGLFYGLLVIQATMCFWSTESLEVMNLLTYGGVETASYPMPIYPDAFRRFFTFVVPLACVTYLPVVSVLDVADPLGTPMWAQRLAPAAGVVFFLVSLLIWRLGVRRYRSAGS